MKEKYLIGGHRVVCDSVTHHIYKITGDYHARPCSCNEYPNNDPEYWRTRVNGKQCGETKKVNGEIYRCPYPAYHSQKCNHFEKVKNRRIRNQK